MENFRKQKCRYLRPSEMKRRCSQEEQSLMAHSSILQPCLVCELKAWLPHSAFARMAESATLVDIPHSTVSGAGREKVER